MQPYAGKRRPQLSLDQLLHVRWLLGSALALISIWTLFYLESSIWPVAMLATGAVLLTVLHPRLPGRVPGWLWRLGMPVITIVFVVDATLNELIPAFVRLNVLLVLFRTVSYRTRREELQLAALCLFLIVSTGVLTVSMVFAVQILLFTGVGMVFLFIINLTEDALGLDGPTDRAWVDVSRMRLLVRMWHVMDLHLVALTSALFVTIVVVATIIFFAIPRFEVEGGINVPGLGRTRSVSGFSERITLGEVTDIAEDDSIALRVDVLDGTPVPVSPYWRMVVLDEYDRGSFRVSRAMEGAVGVRSLPLIDFTPEWRAAHPDEARTAAGLRSRVRIYLEGGVSRHLPLPASFQSLKFREVNDLVPNKYFRTVAMDRSPGSMLSYLVDGADFGDVVRDPDFAHLHLRAPTLDPNSEAWKDESVRQRFLDYPSTTLAVPVSTAAREALEREVAAIRQGETLDAEAFARRACAYLATRHRYALGITVPEVEGITDPVVRWLVTGSGGHCEYFAAAFALLSRTAGFPTRAVTGFQGGTWNAYESYFMVRNSHAHAWCEVYDGRGAWIRVDPTPGGGVASREPSPTPLAALETDHSFPAYVDSLRMLWYRRIVGFDRHSQRQFKDTLRDFGATVARWSGAIWDTVVDEFAAWRRSPWSLQNKGDVLAILVVIFLVAWLSRRYGLGGGDVREWFRRGEAANRRRAGEMLGRLRRRLERPIPQRWPEDVVLGLLADLEIIRYGRAERWPEPRRVFRTGRRLL